MGDFWLQPTFPQYRKIVNGEEQFMDGTETPETEIVCYDYSPEYKAALNSMLTKEELMKRRYNPETDKWELPNEV